MNIALKDKYRLGVGRNLIVQERGVVVALVLFAEIVHAVPARAYCIVISAKTNYAKVSDLINAENIRCRVQPGSARALGGGCPRVLRRDCARGTSTCS